MAPLAALLTSILAIPSNIRLPWPVPASHDLVARSDADYNTITQAPTKTTDPHQQRGVDTTSYTTVTNTVPGPTVTAVTWIGGCSPKHEGSVIHVGNVQITVAYNAAETSKEFVQKAREWFAQLTKKYHVTDWDPIKGKKNVFIPVILAREPANRGETVYVAGVEVSNDDAGNSSAIAVREDKGAWVHEGQTLETIGACEPRFHGTTVLYHNAVMFIVAWNPDYTDEKEVEETMTGYEEYQARTSIADGSSRVPHAAGRKRDDGPDQDQDSASDLSKRDDGLPPDAVYRVWRWGKLEEEFVGGDKTKKRFVEEGDQSGEKEGHEEKETAQDEADKEESAEVMSRNTEEENVPLVWGIQQRASGELCVKQFEREGKKFCIEELLCETLVWVEGTPFCMVRAEEIKEEQD